MATPKRHDVTCPVCSHTQREYIEATSTFCHACGHRYSTVAAPPRRKTKSAKTASALHRRRIYCVHCDHPMQIPEASDSWQCPACSEYLDLKDHTINRSVGRSLLTYGSLTFESHGFFSGNRAEAKNIRIAGGSVSGQITAWESLEITRVSKVNGDIKCECFQVAAGAGMESRKSLNCQNAVIEGSVTFREVHVTERLVIKAGGTLRTEILSVPSIEVLPGGRLVAAQACCLSTSQAAKITADPARPAAEVSS
ncbi:MAG: polymer-forming cytoskeletal protein [Verrucomicrobiota bacterium]